MVITAGGSDIHTFINIEVLMLEYFIDKLVFSLKRRHYLKRDFSLNVRHMRLMQWL